MGKINTWEIYKWNKEKNVPLRSWSSKDKEKLEMKVYAKKQIINFPSPAPSVQWSLREIYFLWWKSISSYKNIQSSGKRLVNKSRIYVYSEENKCDISSIMMCVHDNIYTIFGASSDKTRQQVPKWEKFDSREVLVKPNCKLM